jgi:hypothetical protein
MKLQSPSRHSRRRPALPPTQPLHSSAVVGSRATARDPQRADHASPIANHGSPITQFLIGSTATGNARNSSAIITKCISNRSKIACWRARFVLVSRTRNHKSGGRNQRAWLTNYCSAITNHPPRITRLTNANSRYNRAFQRAAGQSNQAPTSSAGLRHPARHETGFGLRSSNVSALILRH